MDLFRQVTRGRAVSAVSVRWWCGCRVQTKRLSCLCAREMLRNSPPGAKSQCYLI